MKYQLEVTCYRNGIPQDGGIHKIVDAETDQQAKDELLPELDWLMKFYTRVAYAIRCNGKVIVSGNR